MRFSGRPSAAGFTWVGNARWESTRYGADRGRWNSGLSLFLQFQQSRHGNRVWAICLRGGAAYCVNDSGEVVGTYTDSATHAFLWTGAGGGTTTDISDAPPRSSA